MIHTKRLRSVIHSLAHYAVSGLSYLHPHAGNASKNAGISYIGIDLLKPGFVPLQITVTKELRLSSEALRDTFARLLRAEGIDPTGIAKGYLQFSFYDDIWPAGCYVKVTTTEDNDLEVARRPKQ